MTDISDLLTELTALEKVVFEGHPARATDQEAAILEEIRQKRLTLAERIGAGESTGDTIKDIVYPHYRLATSTVREQIEDFLPYVASKKALLGKLGK